VHFDFGNALIFFLFGVAFVALSFCISWIIRPNKPSPQKQSTYECGELPLGGSWIQFNMRFYVIALIFIIFEVELIFLFPWAVVLKQIGPFALVEMMIFVGILLVGFAYVWRKGDLDWVRPPDVKAEPSEADSGPVGGEPERAVPEYQSESAPQY
jgi:NADH-quinone oxidoreductase subunit A